MTPFLGVILVFIFLVVFMIGLICFCKGKNKKKKEQQLPITVISGRKRPSVFSNHTYNQDYGHGLATHSNTGNGDGGAAVITGVAAFAAVTALDGGACGAGDGGSGGGS